MLRDNGGYYYNDCYMYFTFKGIYSKKYNLFVVNSKGFTKVNTVGASVQSEAPDYQDMQYYLGTTKSSKTLSYDLACEGLTADEYKNMMLWLAEGQIGFLFFDSDIDWGWDVVVSKVGDATENIYNGRHVYEFNIQFTTIGTYKTRSPWEIVANIAEPFTYTPIAATDEDGTVVNPKTAAEKQIANKWGIPEIVYAANEGNVKVLYMPVIGNCGGYFNYFYDNSDSSDTSTLKIQKDNNIYIDYSFNHRVNDTLYDHTIQYCGNSNYVIADNVSLVENCDTLIMDSTGAQTEGLLTLQGKAPSPLVYNSFNLVQDAQQVNNNFTIILPREQSDILQYMDNYYISVSFIDPHYYPAYNRDEYNTGNYPYQFFNVILFNPTIDNNNTISYNNDTSWNRRLTIGSSFLTQKPLIYYGNFNTIKLTNTGAVGEKQNIYLYKYNNL